MRILPSLVFSNSVPLPRTDNFWVHQFIWTLGILHIRVIDWPFLAHSKSGIVPSGERSSSYPPLICTVVIVDVRFYGLD